jgi:hypothetical protein
VPFLRFARDKRGYEYLSLVQPSTNRRGKVRQRLLYWFRTPPDLKVGREPFDPGVRRALEAQHPDVTFDWERLVNTPIPPPAPDVERWRERRKAERAAKEAARAEAAEEATARATASSGEPPDVPGGPDEAAASPEPLALEPPAGEELADESAAQPAETSQLQDRPAAAAEGRHRRRRRRRRGHGNRPPEPAAE